MAYVMADPNRKWQRNWVVENGWRLLRIEAKAHPGL